MLHLRDDTWPGGLWLGAKFAVELQWLAVRRAETEPHSKQKVLCRVLTAPREEEGSAFLGAEPWLVAPR